MQPILPKKKDRITVSYVTKIKSASPPGKRRKFLAFLLIVQSVLLSPVFAQTVITNPTSPFIVPAGVTSIKAECRGTGGSGGGGTGTISAARSGGGGGGGAYNSGILTVTGGQSINTAIGAQGSTGTGAGGAGGATSFGSVIANGGAGGNSNNGAGGAGGTGIFPGGNGGTGIASTGAGGGGGAGNNGAGGAGSTSAAGTGGVGSPNASPYTGGAGGANSTGDGNDGVVPGGGGGGGRGAAFFGSNSGGVGGLGRVIITYTCPVYSLNAVSTSPASLCTGGTVQVNLSSSAAGLPTGTYTVTYNQSAPNALAGATATITVTTAGTGSFTTAALANSGSTTITITNLSSGSGTGCSSAIGAGNTAVVGVNALPTVFTVSGGGAYCSGGAGVPLNLSGSQTGVNYTLLNGAATVTTFAGTGSALSFGPITVAGTYTINAVNAVSGCSRVMTGNAVVSINPLPSFNSITANPAVICLGSVSTLTANPVFTAATTSLGAGATNTAPTSTTATLGPNPFQDYYGGAKQQLLIRASELTAMGLENGSVISALQIQLAVANTGYTLQNFRVKIQHTALNALTSAFTTSGFTTVFGPAAFTPAGAGFNSINFSNTFTWNGTSNLLIETNYSNNNSPSTASNTAVYGSTAFVSTAFYRVDNITAAAMDAVTTASFTYSSRNNIKLIATVPPAITWTPVTQLFTNSGASTAYVAGTDALTVYSKANATITYTATATNGFGCTATSNTTVTVNNPPFINTQPVNATVCENGTVSFSVIASGTGVTYQWRRGTTNLVNNSNISGAQTATLTINAAGISDRAANYNVVVSGTSPCNPVTSNNVILTVNTAPGLVCPANAVINTDANVCSATRTFSAAATGSPAPTVSYLVNGNFITFPYAFPLGTTTVDVLAEGACAPDATCSFTVTVNDLQGPLADLATLPVITGECSVTVSAAPTATDACDGAFVGTTTDPLTYNTQGTHTITWTYTDTKGNTSTQTQTVIVDDITAPTADAATLPDVKGECSATVTAVPTATDNCVGAVTGTTTDPLTYTTQGTHVITWSFNDGNGNVSTQTQNVIVDDITNPVPDQAVLPTITAECTATATAPTATDNCVGSVTGTTTDPLTYNTQGTYTIIWSFNDGNGNVATQTQTVIIDDITAPVANIAQLADVTAECSVTLTAPVATDNCVGTVTGTTTDPLTYNTQGTFTVNWTYDDGNGNTSTQTQQVIIDDITAPVANITNLPDAVAECSITVSAPTATDNCVGSVTATTTDPVTFSAQGTYTINWTYNDGNGNESSQSQNVIIDDITAPVPDVANLPNITGECSANVSATPTATDNCSGLITATTTDPLVYSAQGTYTITWTYNDGNGNVSTQTQTVIINDVTAPVITCAGPQSFCSVPGSNYTIPLLGAADNCGIAGVSYSITGVTSRTGNGNDASGLFNDGVSTITWTVTDINNNVSTCTTTVSVSLPPATPSAINGFTNACPYIGTGEQITYSVDPVQYATGYQWTVPSTVTLVSGQGTSTITVTINQDFNANPNPVTRLIRVRSLSNCGNSAERLLYLLAQFPSTPGAISGPTDICSLIGTNNTATYTINKVTAATSYAWTTQSGNTTVVHPNGPGLNDTVIVVTYGAGFTSSAITVAAVNGCGTSGSVRSLFIQRKSASTPGLISGPTNVCANILPDGTAATYSIVPVQGATSYTWTTPANAVVTHPNGSGANDYSITLQFPAGFTNGTISVSATNGCGTSGLRTLNVTRLNPATPGIIDVIQVQSCPDRQYSYTISSVPANSTGLLWSIPTAQGAVKVAETATSITVSYPSTSIAGTVTVQSFNNCGSSTIRSTQVRLPACPPPGDFVKGGNNPASAQASTLAADQLSVKVYPNPSVSDFNLQVLSAGKEKITIRIFDMQGRQFKTATIMPYQQLKIGSDLKAGTYILEVTQGTSRRTEKLQKF